MTAEDVLHHFASNEAYEQMCVSNALLFFEVLSFFVFQFFVEFTYQSTVFFLPVNSFRLKVVLRVPQIETPWSVTFCTVYLNNTPNICHCCNGKFD